MGSISIMNSTGHVEITWSDLEIIINLNPSEGKASSTELKQVVKLINKAADLGFSASCIKPSKSDIILDTPIEEIPHGISEIILKKSTDAIKDLIESVFKSDIISNRLVFKIDKNGKGELIQKSDFDPDDSSYLATAPLAGG